MNRNIGKELNGSLQKVGALIEKVLATSYPLTTSDVQAGNTVFPLSMQKPVFYSVIR